MGHQLRGRIEVDRPPRQRGAPRGDALPDTGQRLDVGLQFLAALANDRLPLLFPRLDMPPRETDPARRGDRPPPPDREEAVAPPRDRHDATLHRGPHRRIASLGGLHQRALVNRLWGDRKARGRPAATGFPTANAMEMPLAGGIGAEPTPLDYIK